MADSFSLAGGYTVSPQGDPLSFAPFVEAQINESVTLQKKLVRESRLTVDGPIAVSFDTITNAHIIILKAVGGKCRARFTSADGATQAIPFDTYLITMSEQVPITALDLTRVNGIDTTVRIFIGEKA